MNQRNQLHSCVGVNLNEKYIFFQTCRPHVFPTPCESNFQNPCYITLNKLSCIELKHVMVTKTLLKFIISDRE